MCDAKDVNTQTNLLLLQSEIMSGGSYNELLLLTELVKLKQANLATKISSLKTSLSELKGSKKDGNIK